jgi:hypothetical protein
MQSLDTLPEKLPYELALQLTRRYCNDQSRLPALGVLRKRMERREWLRLLGEEWSLCDNFWRYRDSLEISLGRNGPVRDLMNDEEWSLYQTLPEAPIIYRAASKGRRTGISWTLKREIAEKFPTYPKYFMPNPILYTARVRKCEIIAVKLDRQEFEVITFAPRMIAREPLVISSKD